jgi:ferrochelatase
VKKVAILLLNLGGPVTQADVQGFLYNLFKDKRIISLPFGIRHGVAALISSRRASDAQKNYMHMGGGSPILSETRAQADALQSLLASRADNIEAKVFVGMRYWHPFIEETVKDIDAFSPDEVVLLPLYPQFSSTTTLSAFEAFDRVYKGSAKVSRVCCYTGNHHFIEAHAQLINAQLVELERSSEYRLLFSAHGLPQQIVDRGDPYPSQIEATVARVLDALPSHNADHAICYQSRVGPLKWLEPSTSEAILTAGRDGKNIILIPIAFVSEHIETLVELDIEYAHLASKAGVKDYRRVPALRTQPTFIEGLYDEAVSALRADAPVKGDGNCRACHKFCPNRGG